MSDRNAIRLKARKIAVTDPLMTCVAAHVILKVR